MFFRRTHNRKKGREHVLDVKLRSSKVRAARLQVFAKALLWFFVLILAVGLYFFVYNSGVRIFALNNPAFALSDIQVTTDGVLSPSQLARWTGVKRGENLLALDLHMVRRHLEMIPCIKSVAIERLPPSILRVRVNERVPLAQINLPQPAPGGGIEIKIYTIDETGVVMLPIEDAHRAVPLVPGSEFLPIISGMHPNDVQAGRRIDSQRVQSALSLLKAFQRSPMAGVAEIRRIDVSAPEVLIATADPGCTVTFGLFKHELQLARWREIYQAASRMGKVILTLDLAVSNNVPAILGDAGLGLPPAIPPATLKPQPKNQFNRKKHV